MTSPVLSSWGRARTRLQPMRSVSRSHGSRSRCARARLYCRATSEQDEANSGGIATQVDAEVETEETGLVGTPTPAVDWR
jgi:hypothetical protein